MERPSPKKALRTNAPPALIVACAPDTTDRPQCYPLEEANSGRRAAAVAIGRGGSYRSHWTPEVVRVLGVVESDHLICKGQIEQCEHAGTLCRAQMMRLCRCLGDLVPVVLDRSVPERRSCLVHGGRDAVAIPSDFTSLKTQCTQRWSAPVAAGPELLARFRRRVRPGANA